MNNEESNLINSILSILIGFSCGFVLGLIGLFVGGLILYLFLDIKRIPKFYPMLFFLISGIIGVLLIVTIILFKV